MPKTTGNENRARWVGRYVRYAAWLASAGLGSGGFRAKWMFVGLFLGTVCGVGTQLSAQTHKWHEAGFEFRRMVELPTATEKGLPEVMVVDFFTHGAVTREQPEIVVYSNRELAPVRVLQRGPGDLCRIAIQVQANQHRYFIYYGGTRTDRQPSPEWTTNVGLILETRAWKDCDLSDFASVRRAYETSPPLGADFVGRVFHAHNPHAADAIPFMSRYAGILNVPLSGKCAFYTSSQDCSFLSIDNQLVVSAPGAHGPDSQAKIVGELELQEGPHRFEYLHAARGDQTCMVAAWKLPGFDKPNPIAPSAFRDDEVIHATPARPEIRDGGTLPDFRVSILGDIPSPDGTPALVRVQFFDTSARAAPPGAKVHWEFGDGQTSDQANPGHIYLHPGAYPVRLAWQHGGSTLEATNVVSITRHFMADPKQATSEDQAVYLKLLDSYNASQLDAFGLAQLVRAYLAGGELRRAVDAGRAALEATQGGQTEDGRWDMVNVIGPVLRFQLHDPKEAAQVWIMGIRQLKKPAWRFACAVEAADTLINDLFAAADAKPLLDGAGKLLGDVPVESRGKFYRVLGDFEARCGQGEAARTAYLRAQQTGTSTGKATRSVSEATAWRGAHSRSCEAFLREDDLDRARESLERWQDEFPEDKIEGYWALLKMRYWMAGELPRNALVVASDSLVVHRHSAYADRLTFLSAKCEEQQGRWAQAVAIWRTLLTDYPGSPLVEPSRQEIQRLEQALRDQQEKGPPPVQRGGQKGEAGKKTEPAKKGEPGKKSEPAKKSEPSQKGAPAEKKPELGEKTS